MSRRKLHFRHPNGASDTPFCNEHADSCLTTDRIKEVECRKCQRQIEADEPRQKEFRQLQRQMVERWWAGVWEQAVAEIRAKS